MKQTLFFVLMVFLVSCSSTKKIRYFQDEVIGESRSIPNAKKITVKSGDKISIVVSAVNPELSVRYNLPKVQQTVDGGMYAQQSEILGYIIDSEGNISFPELGEIHVAGLTREEIAIRIRQKLIEEGQIANPIVNVDFINLTFSVMGEVIRPGQFNITKDRVTILDALSMAGDMTIFGKRDKILLVRQGETRTTYQLDLRSSKIYDSPAFYVEQNDVIYVEPNNVRAGQSTINGNSMRSVSLWMSIASFLTTIGVLVFK